MKILITHELGSGRDGQVRILAISKLLKLNYPECQIILCIKKSPEHRFYNSRFIDKIIDSPVDLFRLKKCSDMGDYVAESFLATKETSSLFFKTWDELFCSIRPSLVIADNSPSAVVISKAFGIPFFQVSDGFHHILENSKLEEIVSKIAYTQHSNNLADVDTLIVNSPVFIGGDNPKIHFVHLDAEKDDDGGLPIDIFAYIKKGDPIAGDIISALDRINNDYNKSVLVVMSGIDPVVYKPNFELTPHFVRLQGALYGSPLVIHNFGSGLLLEALKNHCPVWGSALTPEQARMRSLLRMHYHGKTSPSSREDIFSSLLEAVSNKQALSENSKRIWQSGLKLGVSTLTNRFNEVVSDLI